jgi:hypothetical protein
LLHDIFRAASRAAVTAGSRRATKIPMIEITTSSSTNVKPSLLERGVMVRFIEMGSQKITR